jgi:hypothetical protein
MVWSIALANILGAGLCFLFSGQFAKIATLRYTLILPIIIVFVFVGAFTASSNWGDIYTMLIFAAVGWVMKQQRWPRPPLLLGFVLGGLIERYMFISTSRYGLDWLGRPLVIVLLGIAALLLLLPFYRQLKSYGGARAAIRYLGRPQFRFGDLFYVAIIALSIYVIDGAWDWQWGAKAGPVIVATGTLGFCTISLLNTIFSRGIVEARVAAGEAQEGLHMDSGIDVDDISHKDVIIRTGVFLGYLLALVALMAAVGLIVAIPVFLALYMRVEGKEKWTTVLALAAGLTLFVYVVFDRVMHVPWPATFVGQWIPALKIIPAV